MYSSHTHQLSRLGLRSALTETGLVQMITQLFGVEGVIQIGCGSRGLWVVGRGRYEDNLCRSCTSVDTTQGQCVVFAIAAE